MNWLARPPGMNLIELDSTRVGSCLQRRIAVSNVQCRTRESLERSGHDSSYGNLEVDLELLVTLH